PPDRGVPFECPGAQPLPVRPRLVAAVDGGGRRGYPARLIGRADVGPNASLPQSEFLAGLQQRTEDGVPVRGLPNYLQPGHLAPRDSGHGVVERPHRAARDRELAHLEEPDVIEGAAVGLGDDFPSKRTVELVTEGQPLLVRVGWRALVPRDLNIVVTGFRMVGHPVRCHWRADEAVMDVV